MTLQHYTWDLKMRKYSRSIHTNHVYHVNIMDTIEPFENVEDITVIIYTLLAITFLLLFQLPTATFGPDGVSLQELREGAQLNIDRSSFPMSDEQYEEDKGFSKEDMWQYINTECIDPPEDSDMVNSVYCHMTKLSKLLIQ